MSQDEDEKVLAELIAGGSGKAPKPAKREKKESVDDAPEKVKEKEKAEEVVFETPQDRFRKVIRDQGYNKGIENMTSVFFRGDTDNPKWLDETLILSNIPAKNREMIITAYYGRTLADLGIKVEPGSKSSNMTLAGSTNKTNEPNKDNTIPDDMDITKMAEKDLADMFKMERFKANMANIRAMREEAEARSKSLNNQNNPPPPQVFTRQISRPIFKEGQIAKDTTGNILYETVSEPVNPNMQSNSGVSDIMPLILSMMQQNKPQQNTEMGEYFKRMDERIQSMERGNELRAKEDQIKRIEEEKVRKEEQYRRDIELKDKEYKERLEKLEENNKRDLQQLETRFTETINHRKELDQIIGQISGDHKKEMDIFKQKLEHAQTSIERTVVAKGTDTVDKLTTSFADIAESVVKPMAGVLKDQYSLGIDQQRLALGLPPLKNTLPNVTEDELKSFVQ